MYSNIIFLLVILLFVKTVIDSFLSFSWTSPFHFQYLDN